MSTNWVVSANSDDVARIRYNDAGLVPVIAQEESSGRVLMLAWADAEAIRRTLEEGRVSYFSRSRQEYWRKGDTSGNIQVASRLEVDCDGDTVLLRVSQTGPSCHTGKHSCFDDGESS